MKTELISLKFDRSGINGVEGKSDAEILTEWLKASFSAVMEQGAEVMTHIVVRRCMDKFEKAASDPDRSNIELTSTELTLIRWAIMSSRFPGNSNRLVCRLAEKFGITYDE
jgi:hypothetical protein